MIIKKILLNNIIQHQPRIAKITFRKKIIKASLVVFKIFCLFSYFFLMNSCGFSNRLSNSAKIVDMTFYERSPSYTKAHPATNVAPYIVKNSFVKVKVVPQKYYEFRKTGVASLYGQGDNTHGRLTASGMLFDANAMMAAMRDVPIPCIANVTNLRNGRKVEVLIADRGPFAKINSRIIDLSVAAGNKLGMGKTQLAPVLVEVNVKKSLQLAKTIPSYRERVKLAMRKKQRLTNGRIKSRKKIKNKNPVVSPFKTPSEDYNNHPFLTLLDNDKKVAGNKKNILKNSYFIKRAVKVWRINEKKLKKSDTFKIWSNLKNKKPLNKIKNIFKKPKVINIKLFGSQGNSILIAPSPFKLKATIN